MIPTGSANFIDMVACYFHHCLYIVNAVYSNLVSPAIIRLEMPSKHTEWKVENLSSDAVISVTRSHHVLVLLGGGARKLKLFSTDGVLQKTVELHPDISSVTCAVELIPGQYVVTHGRDSDALHRVCVVNSEGKILHTFGGFRGSHPKLLDSPSDVGVDKDGFVYVDDEKNNRLIVLSQDLSYLLCMPDVFPKSDFHRRLKVDKESGCFFVRHVYLNGWLCVNRITMFEI